MGGEDSIDFAPQDESEAAGKVSYTKYMSDRRKRQSQLEPLTSVNIHKTTSWSACKRCH